MNRRQRKFLVKDLVSKRDLPGLVDLAERDARTIGALCSLLYQEDELNRWRTIEALGLVAGIVSKDRMESVRELLRRLEWLMNDESGGAGWHSPEAMAAIVINVPNLQKTFGVLLGAYLDDEPLRRGAHWAVAAISAERPDLYKDRVDGLKTSLEDSDPWIRGCAVLALAYVVPDDLQGMTEGVGNDEGELALYRRSTGELHPTTVGELVIQAVSGAEGSVPVVPVW